MNWPKFMMTSWKHECKVYLYVNLLVLDLHCGTFPASDAFSLGFMYMCITRLSAWEFLRKRALIYAFTSINQTPDETALQYIRLWKCIYHRQSQKTYYSDARRNDIIYYEKMIKYVILKAEQLLCIFERNYISLNALINRKSLIKSKYFFCSEICTHDSKMM